MIPALIFSVWLVFHVEKNGDREFVRAIVGSFTIPKGAKGLIKSIAQAGEKRF